MTRETIQDIRMIFKNTVIQEIPNVIRQYEQDERSGVIAIIASYQKKFAGYIEECKRLEHMRAFENQYPECELICGIDEAGRGPLAGPVMAGAVILPKDVQILYLNDSKKLTAACRDSLYEEIMEKAVSYGVGVASAERIDEINILQATYEAMRLAVMDLDTVPDLLLNDAVTIPEVPIRQIGIVKGDSKSVSIAAASIIAKVTRDRMMEEYAQLFPEYGFEQHKGYGTTSHIEALKKHGPCPIHRLTFIQNIWKGM